MRIHSKPASQWRGMPEIEVPVEEIIRNRRGKRKKNDYASILFKLKRRVRTGLKDTYYWMRTYKFSWER